MKCMYCTDEIKCENCSTKQQTHSYQSVWDEMIKRAANGASNKAGYTNVYVPEGFKMGASFAEKNLKHIPKVKELIEAVEKMSIAKCESGNYEAAFKGMIIWAERALSSFNGSNNE